MGAALLSEEVVDIRLGKNTSDPIVITVNCTDKLGLSCDLACMLFEFGLTIVKGDVTTDGRWCYLVFWVLPRQGSHYRFPWAMLKKNLLSVCPPNPTHFFLAINSEPKPAKVYVLRIFSMDRVGLLNDMTQGLWELEIIIQKVKASTTPEGRVMDLFFVTDKRDLLHTKKRQDEVCGRIKIVSGESTTNCDVCVAPPELGRMECKPLSLLRPTIFEDLCKLESTEFNSDRQQADGGNNEKTNTNGYSGKTANGYSGNSGKVTDILTNKVSVKVDNSLSHAHTLLQISCKDHKGLFYDALRTLKDYNLQVSYGRLSTDTNGICDMDLFIMQSDGKKILDPEKLFCLCSRLEVEISHPIRVKIVDCGPDTELLVACRVEISGKCRPRVLYDVTLVLKTFDICIFMVDCIRCVIADLQWDVYRFLLIDRPDLSLGSSRTRSQITERVENMLIG